MMLFNFSMHLYWFCCHAIIFMAMVGMPVTITNRFDSDIKRRS